VYLTDGVNCDLSPDNAGFVSYAAQSCSSGQTSTCTLTVPFETSTTVGCVLVKCTNLVQICELHWTLAFDSAATPLRLTASMGMLGAFAAFAMALMLAMQ
jgi:hypothetical protein